MTAVIENGTHKSNAVKCTRAAMCVYSTVISLTPSNLANNNNVGVVCVWISKSATSKIRRLQKGNEVMMFASEIGFYLCVAAPMACIECDSCDNIVQNARTMRPIKQSGAHTATKEERGDRMPLPPYSFSIQFE